MSSMNYNCFKKDIIQRVRERVSQDCTVEVNSVTKNNGVRLDSMMIRRPQAAVCPNIYLNPVYEEYLKGLSMDQAADVILSAWRRAGSALDLDPGQLISHDIIRGQVVYRLVNYERNLNLLEEVPHKRFLNLALIYYVMVYNEEMGSGAVMIRDHMLEYYDMTTDEIDEAARINTPRLLPADFLKISDLLREFGEKSGAQSYKEISMEEESAVVPLYVLTNRMRQFGAYYMTDTEVLGRIASQLDADLFLLPSSVHECMVVPAGQWEEAESLASMVREINLTQVSADEYLSDTVYRYEQASGSLVIAA